MSRRFAPNRGPNTPLGNPNRQPQGADSPRFLMVPLQIPYHIERHSGKVSGIQYFPQLGADCAQESQIRH